MLCKLQRNKANEPRNEGSGGCERQVKRVQAG